MALGLEAAMGVEGGWDALHRIIAERKKDEILKYKQEEDRRQYELQLKQQEESDKWRQLQFQGLQQDREARNQDRDAVRAETERQHLVTAIKNRFGSLPGGTNVDAASYTEATQQGEVDPSLFTPNKIDPKVLSTTMAPGPLGGIPVAPQTFKYGGSAAWQQHQADQEAKVEAARQAQLDRESNIRLAGSIAAGNRGTQELTPLQTATQTRLLANDWQRYTAPQRIMERQLGTMEAAIKQVDAGKPFGADEAILVSFERALDPNSVVRESEYARAGGGMALIDQLYGMVKRARMGGAAVPPELLHQIVDLSRQFATAEKAYNAREKQRVSDVATSLKIDPTHVFGREDEPPPPPPPGAQPGRKRFNPATGKIE